VHATTVNGITTIYAATAGGLSVGDTSGGGAVFTNKNTGDGLGSNTVNGVYAVGSTVYAATAGGLSISTDGGDTYTNKTLANNQLGSNTVNGVYAATVNGITTIYAGALGMNISQP
jgi:hypothetical protein